MQYLLATRHNDTQHNDTQHNDTQHNDTQHNDTMDNKKYATFSITTLINQHMDIQRNNS
jgi:hypothetical protein